MIGIALRTLRHRKGAFAGAFVALLCAAALVCACLMLLETGLRGGVAPERYAGTPVVVAADQYVRQSVDKGDGETKTKAKPLTERAWLPASVADGLRRAPGVSRVVTEVTFPFGASTGHGWESAALTPFTIARGREPRAAGEVVVDARAGLAVGAELRGHRVVGVTAQALPSQDTVFFSTAEARRLAGHPGKVSAIGVFGTGEVAVPEGAVVHTGDERGRLEFLDAEQARVSLISMGGALAGTSLLVAILVVVGTFALSVRQRHRELALLRAVAATPKQVRALVGGEALLVGVAAGVLGAGAGVGLGLWLHGTFVALGTTPANLRLVVSPFPPLAAFLATVGAAQVAARVSARRISRIRPVEALGEAALDQGRLPWWRAAAGAVCVAGGVVLVAVLSGLRTEAAATPVTMLTALLWTVAVTLLGPLLARAAVRVLPLGAAGVSGFLAGRSLRAAPKGLAAVLAPLTLLVAMTCTILFAPATVGRAAEEQARAGLRAGHVVTGAGAAAVARVPGVEAVVPVLRTTVRAGLDKYAAQAVAYDRRVLDLDVTAGSMDAFGEDAVAISGTAAARLGIGAGDPLALTLGDGTPARLTVAAVYARGLGFGDLTLPYDLVTGHVDDPAPTLLVSAPGLAAAALRAALPPGAEVSAVTGGPTGGAAGGPTGGAAGGGANQQAAFVALGLIIAFTAIAVVNTLAMATSGRARELAALRLAGTTRRQVLRMLRLETLGAVLVAAVLGTGVALVTLAAFGAGMTGSATPSVPPVAYALVIAATAGLALVATAVPARLVLRVRPAEAVTGR
ncbi:ABC transporter permease [Actinomadura sp. ATCC 31491]|uniref:ABC transporter permease n=1 Tax=Actinomadura luzonensis TaxID=2805427 RepID=A0ABT0GBC1_9ACTN|nr:ABC transporter permease [Actinomadura luzonensis]MCK2221774.1 ABC transporter permease [Actinomadura luzonensis]